MTLPPPIGTFRAEYRPLTTDPNGNIETGHCITCGGDLPSTTQPRPLGRCKTPGHDHDTIPVPPVLIFPRMFTPIPRTGMSSEILHAGICPTCLPELDNTMRQIVDRTYAHATPTGTELLPLLPLDDLTPQDETTGRCFGCGRVRPLTGPLCEECAP